jgi:hypothetical protein
MLCPRLHRFAALSPFCDFEVVAPETVNGEVAARTGKRQRMADNLVAAHGALLKKEGSGDRTTGIPLINCAGL